MCLSRMHSKVTSSMLAGIHGYELKAMSWKGNQSAARVSDAVETKSNNALWVADMQN